MTRHLWQKVLLGMALGCCLGAFIPGIGVFARPWANLYMNLIKMIVVPTIFCAVLSGIANSGDIHTVHRISLKAAGVYLAFTVTAVLLGICFGCWLQPGVGVAINLLDSSANLTAVSTSAHSISLAQLFVDAVPNNPIAAMASGNTLQIVIFALLLGVATLLAGEPANTFKANLRSLTSVVFKLVELVVRTTPYGAVAIMAWVVDRYGYQIILRMGKLVMVIMLAFACQYLIFGLVLHLFGLSCRKFYGKTFNTQSLAFATSSSKATISTAMHDLEHNLGVSQRVVDFVLPLGATINMSGSAIYIVVCALFFAQNLQLSLTLSQYLILIITATIGSIGAAGYPSGAVIMLGMVLPSIGLPIEGIPLVMGVDRLLDMFRTVINVTGDCAATLLVDKLEKSLDQQRYDA